MYFECSNDWKITWFFFFLAFILNNFIWVVVVIIISYLHIAYPIAQFIAL